MSKTVNGVEHKYIWQGDRLLSESYVDTELEFFYDESGKPYSMSYKGDTNAEPVMYYYVTNLQGDIMSIVDAEGFSVAEYYYNAWGLPMGTLGALAEINPLRYRGYYFDTETGLYYLKSRYYDPFVCRFINEDKFASTGQEAVGCNMFAYCLNNPLIFFDDEGSFAVAIPLIALGKILFDGCATIFTLGILWDIGSTIGETIKQKQKTTETYNPVSVSQVSQREAISQTVSISFARSKAGNYRKDREWHHLVAQRAPNARYARAILKDVDIDIDSSMNGILIKTGLHRRLHTNLYYGWANSVVISAYRSAGGNDALEKDRVMAALGSIKGFVRILDAVAPY